MEDFINQDLLELEDIRAEREAHLVEWTLDSFADKVGSQERDINALLLSSRKQSVCERAVMEHVTKCLADVLDGKLAVVDYSQKNKAKQIVYVFLGTHWEVIIHQQYIDFVKKCLKRMMLSDLYCEDQNFMNSVFERLAFRVMHYRRLCVRQGEIWINLQNCTLEIKRNGSVVQREHRAEDFFTYVLPYAYDPSFRCPRWHRFLDRVLPECDAQTLLAEAIGYCFTRNLKLEKMFVFYGMGSNGKSVCLDVITKLMGGMKNVSNISLSSLTTDDEKRSHLENKLVNISHESGAQLDAAILKQLVSGEPTEVRTLYRGSHIMLDPPKFMTSYNTLPNAENTYGFYRRWILFPFNVTIPDEEQDVDLTNKLCAELPGIFNWVLVALAGLLIRKAFTKSAICTEAGNDFKRNAKSTNQFFFDMCEISEGDSLAAKLSDLYNAYTRYCRDEELPNRSGKKAFQDALRSFGAVQSISHNAIYYNVKIKEEI